MTPEEIKAIRTRSGMSARAMSDALGMAGSDGRYIRAIESGERVPGGSVVRLLEMLDRGELPARYLPEPLKRGRPKKDK